MSIQSWSIASLASTVTSQTSNPSNQSFGAPSAGPTATPTGTAATGTPAGTPPAPAGPNPLSSMLLPFALVMGLIFFMQWRQGKNERKRMQDMVEALGKGDEVRMSGGEIGRIHDVRDNEIVVEFEQGRARYVKNAVAAILKSKKGAAAAIETKSEQKEPAGA